MSDCPDCEFPTQPVAGPRGLKGDTGPAGADGAPGYPAYGVTTEPFTMPIVGATVTVTMDSVEFLVLGSHVVVEGAGIFLVDGKLTATTASLERVNLPYSLVAADGATVAAGKVVTLVSVDTADYQTQIDALVADVAGNAAAILAEQTVRAGETGALSTLVTTAQATADDAAAAVVVEAAARVAVSDRVATVEAYWGVKIDVNGRVVGRIRLDGNAETSELTFMHDKLQLANPAAPSIVFKSFTRTIATTVDHTFRTADGYTGFTFPHANPVTLYGPAHPDAASNLTKIVNIRADGGVELLILARLVGYTGTHCVYWRKNGAGSYYALYVSGGSADTPFCMVRGADVLTGLTPADKIELWVAPCDENGDIPAGALLILTPEMDVVPMNW